MTPDQLRARIAHLEEQERQQVADLLFTRKDLEMCRQHLRLLSQPSSTTDSRAMQPASRWKDPEKRKKSISRGSNEHLDHPFVAAVLASSKYGSVAAWALAHDRKLGTVATWYGTGKFNRKRIPRSAADEIEREFPDVPATEETWTNGIFDD